jgi:hypothetical protein
MEEKQKKKFVCKFCNKRYPCGKALGGHIRTHMNRNSAQMEEEAQVNANVVGFPSVNGGIRSKRDSGSEAAAWNSVYGLRENPKKTWRISDSGACLLQERVCKECGKGFQSLKALCGHMACHSDKEKLISKFEEKPVMDSHSVNETWAPRQLRRSKRTRYEILDVYYSANTLANASSSVSEIEQEQEEGAMCLMMLSRDSGRIGGLNSVAESSDNDSVVLEPKSSPIDVKMTMKNGRTYVSNTNQFVKLKKQREKKLKTAVISLCDHSDSGYFRNGTNKAEGDASVDGSFAGDEFEKPKVECGSGIGGFDAELGESSNRFKYVISELGKELIINAGYGQMGRALMEYDDSGMRAKNDSYSPEFLEGSNTKVKENGSSNIESGKNAQTKSKYECSSCNMFFQSHRALGGHRASHTKINRCCEPMYESGENNIDNDSLPVPKPHGKTSIKQSISAHSEKRLGPKKSKGHECPICFRVFRSGQALGGHKRSHFFGGSEERTVVIKQELSEFPGLIDLNLPAPIEEEANGHAEFMPC